MEFEGGDADLKGSIYDTETGKNRGSKDAAGGNRARDLQISQMMALRRFRENPMSLAP
jgi:hypothetical protein